MSKRTVSGITLTLLLIGMLTLAFNIQSVKASGTIYIRANGSVDPDTAPISTFDNVTYTFTDNINDSIVVKRDNIVVDGDGYTINGTGSGRGIDLSGRSNITIRNVSVVAFEYGIYLEVASGNTLIGNNIKANIWCGIVLGYASNNIISENNITNNNYGIGLFSSSNCTISYNNIASNIGGIDLMVSSNNNTISYNNIRANKILGVHFCCMVSNNTVCGNSIYSNSYGVWMERESSNNTVCRNSVYNNCYGVWLQEKSSNNKFYHNNFIDNTQQIHFYMSVYANLWGDGYPSGGNYWSDHNPQDLFGGPYQNETGSDGIGDTPYVIDANNRDRYPLIYPYSYAPSPDVNNDRTVDKLDLVLEASAYGSIPGESIWNPYCDINQDGIIDIFDLIIVAVNYGKTHL